MTSMLERKYPEWAAFLKWHDERIKMYTGAVRVELHKAARDFVCKNAAHFN